MATEHPPIPHSPTHALYVVDNSTGDQDKSFVFAFVHDGSFFDFDTGHPVLEYDGDKIVRCWPLCGEHEVTFTFQHPDSGEVKTASLGEKEIFERFEDELVERLCDCGCEAVGETNVVECNCDEYYSEFAVIPTVSDKR